MKRVFGRTKVAKLLVTLFIVALLSGGAFAAEKVIKIGTLFPLTGPCALAGQRCQSAVETAVEVINNAHPEIKVPGAATEGVLGGMKFVLVHADHQGKPDVAKSEAERLIDQEGVYAIIGSYNSSCTKPASFVAERKQKLFVCGCSSSAALTKRDLNRFFRLAPTDETESLEFVEFIKHLNETRNAGIETVGLIYENTEFGKHAAEEGKAAAGAAGLKVIADVAFNPGATNLNSEVQTLKAADPDAVFGACLGGDYTLWVRTMKQMDWLPDVALNYCTGYQDPIIAKQLESDGDFFMGGTGYSPEFAELMPAVAAVEKIYMTKTDPSVPFDSDCIQEAIATLILAQAMELAGTTDYDAVLKVLHETEFDSPMSLGGKVVFAPGGQNLKAMSILTQLQGGSYKKIYPLDLADTEPVVPMTDWSNR